MSKRIIGKPVTPSEKITRKRPGGGLSGIEAKNSLPSLVFTPDTGFRKKVLIPAGVETTRADDLERKKRKRNAGHVAHLVVRR